MKTFTNYAPFNCSFGYGRGCVVVTEYGATRLPLPPLGEYERIDWNGKAGEESESAYRVRFPEGEHGAAAKRFARRAACGVASLCDLARLEQAHRRSIPIEHAFTGKPHPEFSGNRKPR
jgi:hypothetical protein